LCRGNENGIISFFIGVGSVQDIIKSRRLYDILYNSLGNLGQPCVGVDFLYNIKEVLLGRWLDGDESRLCWKLFCIHKIIFYDELRVSPCKSEKKVFFWDREKLFFLADADTCAGRDRGVPTLAAAGGWLLQGGPHNL
jgi:hypothetical protein